MVKAEALCTREKVMVITLVTLRTTSLTEMGRCVYRGILRPHSKEIRDNNKWFAAVARGDEKVVQNLVEEQGFLRKINMKMPRVLGGMTALHVALRFGREEVTVYLVWRCRVKLEPLDAFNRTPIMVAREEKGVSEEAIERQRASIMVVRTAMKEFDKARYLEMLKQEAEVERLRKERELKEKYSRMAYLL